MTQNQLMLMVWSKNVMWVNLSFFCKTPSRKTTRRDSGGSQINLVSREKRCITLLSDIWQCWLWCIRHSLNKKSCWMDGWIDDKFYITKINEHKQVTVCSYHVTYAFQSESTLYSCLNVKKPLARTRSETRTWHDKNIQSNAPYS